MKFPLKKCYLYIIAIPSCLIIGCSASESTYTLYRNSVTDENMRIHISTFNSTDGHNYNMSNCQIAQELFQKQEGIKTKFWCEKGNYKK